MASLTAGEIMARNEATVSPDTDIYAAIHELLTKKLTGVPVVDVEGALIGMLTERDCLKVLVGGALHGLPAGEVRDYMTSPAESISPAATLYDVVHLFLTRPYRKVPVVDDAGRVVGQVSRRDTLVALDSSKDERLFGVDEVRAPDGSGVDSAMRRARSER